MKTKICLSCKKTKSLTQFGANGTLPSGRPKYKARCRSCNHDHEKQIFYLKITKALDGPENLKCKTCGYNKCRAALELHHVDPSKKEHTINKMQNYTYEKIKKEVDKCVLLCANCHRELHSLLSSTP